MKQYVLALDEGTTSARAILFDRRGRIVAMARHEIPQIYPRAGWVEQDPMAIYAAQYASMTECLAGSGIDPDEIAAIGLTNQRETVVVWDRHTGKPVYNAIVWQCRRTAELCAELEKGGYGELIRERTGMRIDPYFSGTKIKWILDNVEGARERAEAGELLFGTVDTWITWKLTEGRVFVTDVTNASRTMLMNLHTGDWDDAMLSLLDIPRRMLPAIKSSSEVYGEVSVMGADLPLSGIAGDQQAALFGQGCFSRGEAKNTYGTGCFLLTHTGDSPVMSVSDLLTTVAATRKGEAMQYALEGSVFVGGAVVQWLRDEVKLINDSCDSEYFASKVSDNGGVYVVPAFTGLGAPYWDMSAQGSILGLTRGTGRDHIIRAALESIVYQTEDVLAAMQEDMKTNAGVDALGAEGITSLKVDGGASDNRLLMQFQSDISGIPVTRPSTAEATAWGAAALAALAVGFFETPADTLVTREGGFIYTPDMDDVKRKALLDGWHRAVKACREF
ncbi:MAG: glycerol kinase GlpK [Clostridia bacterium]|nr:glycerol kinase GlpK [Clostridia bacterium]